MVLSCIANKFFDLICSELGERGWHTCMHTGMKTVVFSLTHYMRHCMHAYAYSYNFSPANSEAMEKNLEHLSARLFGILLFGLCSIYFEKHLALLCKLLSHVCHSVVHECMHSLHNKFALTQVI